MSSLDGVVSAMRASSEKVRILHCCMTSDVRVGRLLRFVITTRDGFSVFRMAGHFGRLQKSVGGTDLVLCIFLGF